MKDGYLEFFKKFSISEDDFLDFARSSIILSPKEKAKTEWDKLKKQIGKQDELVYVRGYGRNGSGNPLYQQFYSDIFTCKVGVDKTNNAMPTKVLVNLTGESKSGKDASLRNYQVSHIFGNTKNPYSFCAPWNIVFLPKILDPFTGHESKGELTNKITSLYKNLMWEIYEDLINDYNNLMSELSPQISSFIDSQSSSTKVIQNFHNSIRSEFSIIKRDKV